MLEQNPRPVGVEKLESDISLYRIRQGNYRIIYQIEDNILRVLVVKVEARGAVYGKKSTKSVKARAKR